PAEIFDKEWVIEVTDGLPRADAVGEATPNRIRIALPSDVGVFDITGCGGTISHELAHWVLMKALASEPEGYRRQNNLTHHVFNQLEAGNDHYFESNRIWV